MSRLVRCYRVKAYRIQMASLELASKLEPHLCERGNLRISLRLTKPMLELYGLPSCAGLRSPSPWVMKVELAMRYLELDYSLVQPQILRTLFTSPSGKVPYLLIDGDPFVESERILKVLEKYAAPRTFPHPGDEDQASGIAFVRLVEDHLFYIVNESKHLDSINTPMMWAEMVPSRWLPISHFINIYGQRKARQKKASTSIGGLTDTHTSSVVWFTSPGLYPQV